MTKRLLLHSCCGPCSSSVIERILEEYKDYELTVFFYNPNIMDDEEYEKRQEAQRRVIEEYGVKYIEGNKNTELYLERIEGFEKEPEGGLRCDKCFELRLETTAKLAGDMGFDSFATTLSVSPHKNYKKILDIGKQLEKIYGVDFFSEDFKKKAGFQRSIELSKEMGLYRQNFCGCEFSK